MREGTQRVATLAIAVCALTAAAAVSAPAQPSTSIVSPQSETSQSETSQSETSPLDTSPLRTSLPDTSITADAAQYNLAQDNLVKGEYEVGFGALSALATATPDDANVVALQAFYANAVADDEELAEHLTRLAELSPTLFETTERALATIADVAEREIDFAQVADDDTAIVVLGLGLDSGGSMSQELIERLRAASATAGRAPTAPIVVTGGNPQSGITEADAMRDWLVDEGIDSGRIHIEPTANSTVQNALRSTEPLESIGVSRVLLATSPSHLRRAISNFEIAGADVVGAAALDPENAPEIPEMARTSRLGLTVDATKVIGIPRTY